MHDVPFTTKVEVRAFVAAGFAIGLLAFTAFGQAPKTELEELRALQLIEGTAEANVPGDRVITTTSGETLIDTDGVKSASAASGPNATTAPVAQPSAPIAGGSTATGVEFVAAEANPAAAATAKGGYASGATAKGGDAYGDAHGGDVHGGDAHGKKQVNLINPDLPMFLLFLVLTLAAFFLLAKYVWKPLLAALDEREATIQGSLDNAAKVEEELAQIETTRAETISAADEKAKVIIEDARKGGTQLQRAMENDGKEQARILRENAEREIGSATEKAQSQLREESADLAVQLASQILGRELDGDKNKSFTDELIAKM